MEDLQEILEMLRAAGVECQSCDEMEWVKVPYYPSGAECGIPRETFDDVNDEYVLLPASMVVAGSTYVIPAVGRSMEGAGIYEGDLLTIVTRNTAQDGDIVLAMVDSNRATVKGYYEDAQGRRWLVPHNDDYEPILITEDMDVRIQGVVKDVTHLCPRMSPKFCERAIRRVAAAQKVEVSQEQIAKAVREVLPLIRYGRQWYAVYRVLADRKVVREGNYSGFLGLLGDIMGDEAPSVNVRELQRMAVQSFARPVAQWDADNAPVVGKWFEDYLNIAKFFARALG